MCEANTEEHAKTALGVGDDQDQKDLPPSQAGATAAWIARSRPLRVLLSDSQAFRVLMFGSSISMLGTRISTVAFPMLVLHLYNSPFITGLVACAAIAPSMLFYIPAGVLVDQWNPRRVMLASELLRGLTIALVLVVLAIFRRHVSIWFLILAMVVEEILEIFCTLADRRYLNRMMKRDKVVSQQASIEVRTHAVVLAGRPVGPFLFSIRPILPFLADAVSFIVSVVSLLLLGAIDEPQGQAQRLIIREELGDIGQRFRRLKRYIGQGIGWLKRDRGQGISWLKRDRQALVTVSLMAMTSMVAQALILMFLVEAHSKQLSTVAVGVVLAASGAGGATGSFASRNVWAVVREYWLPIQMVAWSVTIACLALAGGRSAYWSAVAMFILGLTGAIGNVEFGTYLARKVADDMIAKVTGIGQMLAIGASALGPVLGGYAVQRFHVQGAIWILLVIVVLLAFASLLMPAASQLMARIFRAVNNFPWTANMPSVLIPSCACRPGSISGPVAFVDDPGDGKLPCTSGLDVDHQSFVWLDDGDAGVGGVIRDIKADLVVPVGVPVQASAMSFFVRLIVIEPAGQDCTGGRLNLRHVPCGPIMPNTHLDQVAFKRMTCSRASIRKSRGAAAVGGVWLAVWVDMGTAASSAYWTAAVQAREAGRPDRLFADEFAADLAGERGVDLLRRKESTRYFVARLRAAYARHVGEPDWEEDLRRLSSLSSEFVGLWALHEVAEFQPRVRTFIHQDVGPLTFTTSELRVSAAPEARLVVYTPADDETRKRLPDTRA